MLAGPDAKQFSKAEVATTLAAGAPPRHIARPKPEKKPQSVWQQIKTGDVHKVEHRARP